MSSEAAIALAICVIFACVVFARGFNSAVAKNKLESQRQLKEMAAVHENNRAQLAEILNKNHEILNSSLGVLVEIRDVLKDRKT